MKYPIVIAIGDEKTACDVRIPDLDVYTAADDFEDCYDVAIEAAEIELENKQRAGQEIPMPSQIEIIAKNPECDFTDMERIHGTDLIDIMAVGRNFLLKSEDATPSNSAEPSETTPKPTTPQ